jgi:2-dehydro-3-deoxygluconokinase
MPMPDVVTFGETMALFAPRETGPLRYVADYRLKMGGTESNVAVALARLGIEVGWFSRVGDDELGRFIVHNVRGEGVDTSRAIIDPAAPTGLYLKELSAVGETIGAGRPPRGCSRPTWTWSTCRPRAGST